MKKIIITITAKTLAGKSIEDVLGQTLNPDNLEGAISGVKIQKMHIGQWFPFYVIAKGKDCDGHNSGSITAYDTPSAANKASAEANKWSDGLQYSVVEREDAIIYCNDYNQSIDAVDDCVFDINGKVAD